jgi:hypothetical protein
MVARKALPDDHHVMRYVPRSKQFIDDDENCLGPSPAAFAIRQDDEGGLSVTEVEHFGSMNPSSRALAAAAYRDSLHSKKLGATAVFAWAAVGDIRRAANGYEKTVRIVHAPVDGNPAHAEIRHFTGEDLDLLEYFATDVFNQFETVAAMDIPIR